MKAKNSVSKHHKTQVKLVPLPEPPLHHEDLPTSDELEHITQEEIVRYGNAEHTYMVARADFEMKRGAILRKLIAFCHVDEGSCSVELDKDWRIVLTDASSSGWPQVTRM